MDKQTFKNAAKRTGKGIGLAIAATNNAPIRARLYEIEEEMERLQEEKTKLAKLITKF
jgi:hypothetical protein